jgi:hypothetical protein
MALRMAMSYEPEAAQVNEKSAPETSLDLTLTQCPRDEDPKLRKVHVRLEVQPLRPWYYHISPNFCTLVILLQVDPAFGNEPEIICEGCYEIENTFIFAWFSILDVGHYYWLCGPIRRLPPNSKADYLIRTIQCILNFLQL